MMLFGVILSAVLAFAVGALWYRALSPAWVADSGVPVDAQGRPTGRSAVLAYGGGFLCVLLVAGMLRWLMGATGMISVGGGLVLGLGVGLFLIAPWIALNVLFAMRPLRLAAIDGGYAALACAVMGAVLGGFK